MDNESIQGDEWDAYVALGRTTSTERGIAYGARALGRRSPHSSWRGGHRHVSEGGQVIGLSPTERYA